MGFIAVQHGGQDTSRDRRQRGQGGAGQDRALILNRIAARMEDNLDLLALAETWDNGKPRGITFSHDYKYLFVCASDSNAAQVYDVARKKVIHDLPSGDHPEPFALAPDNKHLYIASENDAPATVVDIESRKVVAETSLFLEQGGIETVDDFDSVPFLLHVRTRRSIGKSWQTLTTLNSLAANCAASLLWNF